MKLSLLETGRRMIMMQALSKTGSLFRIILRVIMRARNLYQKLSQQPPLPATTSTSSISSASTTTSTSSSMPSSGAGWGRWATATATATATAIATASAAESMQWANEILVFSCHKLLSFSCAHGVFRIFLCIKWKWSALIFIPLDHSDRSFKKI